MKGWVKMPGGLAREVCPGENTAVRWKSHHDCSGCEIDAAALILVECELVIFFAIVIIN